MSEYDFWHAFAMFLVPLVCGVIIAAAHAFIKTYFPRVYPFLNQSPWAHLKRLIRRLAVLARRESQPATQPAQEPPAPPRQHRANRD